MADYSEQMEEYGSSPSVIRELYAYGRRRAAQVGEENVFDFSLGNPSVPAPPQVKEKLLELVQTMDPVALHGYTVNQGDMGARTLLAESLNRRFHADLAGEDLFLAAGAAAALCCCFRALSTPECRQWLVFAPFFPEYRVYIEGNGGSMAVIPADTEHFQIDFPALERALDRGTRGVVINSPNNPSGAVYSAATLKKLGELLREKSEEYGHTLYLISDEPYREIVFGGKSAPWVPDFYENTLVCYSFSKSLSLPGERMGYVAVPKKVTDRERVFNAIWGAGRAMGYVNACALFQRVCAACCDLTADLSVYERNRDLLVKELPRMGYELVPPEGTFYLFPRSLEPDDVAFSNRARAHDLLLVPGSGFSCPGHVRIAFCVPTRRVENSLRAFEALAREYGR